MRVWRKWPKCGEGHFSAVLNCLNNERVDVASYNLAYDAEEKGIVSATEIERCIAKLKNGKSNGVDNVSSEHLKNCNSRLARAYVGIVLHENA